MGNNMGNGGIEEGELSWKTANADETEASRNLAKDDLPYMNKYKGSITSVGKRCGMDPAVIAGIISRETRAGRGLNGCGDKSNAFGLMQIDKRWWKPEGEPESEEHISQGTEILVGYYDEMMRKFPCWSKEQWLKGSLAAYNKGASAVDSYDRVDGSTPGGDYSNDVLARAQFFNDNGY